MNKETYKFGVGSSKYELEAKNKDVAKCAMMLFYFDLPANLPIAIYEPITEAFKIEYTISLLDKVRKSHSEDIKQAYRSITKTL